MNKIYQRSFVNTLAAAVYITLVAVLLFNGDKIFGKMEGIVAPVAFLLLFSLSALILGSLILAKPIMLFIEGAKKEAVQMLLASIGWLALFTVIALVILLIK